MNPLGPPRPPLTLPYRCTACGRTVDYTIASIYVACACARVSRATRENIPATWQPLHPTPEEAPVCPK